MEILQMVFFGHVGVRVSSSGGCEMVSISDHVFEILLSWVLVYLVWASLPLESNLSLSSDTHWKVDHQYFMHLN